jgi:hypothetical protein
MLSQRSDKENAMFSFHLLVLCLTLVPFSRVDSVSQQNDKKDKEVIVPRIKVVDFKFLQTSPPSLSVSAVGEVPTGGYQNIRLVRVTFPKPPLDGIQEYRLVATPPAGQAIQVLTEVSASDTWNNYQNDAPWIKGIRVHGIGNGTAVRMFNAR